MRARSGCWQPRSPGATATPGRCPSAVAEAEAEAVAALGRGRFESERAVGESLDPDGVLAELAAAAGAEPPRPLAQSRPAWPPVVR